jgi:hypothetical protein
VGGAIGVFGGGMLADRLATRDKRWYAWLPSIAGFLIVPFMVAVYLADGAYLALSLSIIPGLLFNLPRQHDRHDPRAGRSADARHRLRNAVPDPQHHRSRRRTLDRRRTQRLCSRRPWVPNRCATRCCTCCRR